ncbi:MAG: DUF1553 domain-containing protein [Fimbriiglobus sp.]|nr:DUF1553 domain-containing protein [Fimbriiglobus sp.]
MRSILFFLALAVPAVAAETLPPNAKVAKLDVSPKVVELKGPFAYSQLVVTATLDSGGTADVTRLAQFAPPAGVTVSPNGLVRPTADGKGEVKVSVGGQTISVSVTATDFASIAPVSFVKDVQPMLSKLGCNSGTCHGGAQGKNGFKLSLRGYDPVFDHRSLTDDLEGRRFNRADPDRSLMLLKPTGAVAHAGGVLWQAEDPSYKLVRRWIAEGVKNDLAAPKVKSIEVFPPNVTVGIPGTRQQFAVVATYADGTKRDVSAEAFIESSNTEVVTIDKTGVASTVRRGEATLLVRYEGAYAAAGVVVMGDRSGFEWVQRPTHNFIDELVDAKLKKMKIVASDLCTDEEFVRRLSIDLTGLPPTAAEVRAFLADPKPSQEKRNALVDKLIGSEPFVDHWTNKWGDLLQVNRKFLGDAGATALRKWIRDQVANNTPYDKFAYQLLTTSGSNVESPPAAYYKVLRDADAVMENTTQLFLAIRFNCNKCHDHPFEKWTQDQYFETAAFFAQVARKEDPKFKGQRIGGTAVEGAKPLVEVIEDAKGGDIKHERTGQIATPRFPFTHPGQAAPNTAPRREQFGRWATAPENQYFAKSYVNRIWSYLTGVGIIEPVDDIRAGNPPTNPELLDRLTKEFVDGGFDTRKLMATICKSRTYQLSIKTLPLNKDDDQNYSHALPRRLPAEVLYDAIHRATGSPSKLPGLPAGSRAAQLVDSNVDLPGGFLELFGKPVRESACECERSNTLMLGPVLAMVNGPIVGDAVRDPNNHIVRFTEKEKDDAKVVEEIYLSVLNRRPTAKETETGVKALRDGAKDYNALAAEYAMRKKAFDDYAKSIDAKLQGYEDGLRAKKPTAWAAAKPVKATSKAGATPAAANAAKDGSTLTINNDASVLVSGKREAVDITSVTVEVKQDAPLTGVRLEVLADKSLPAGGPGRADNGNFVLNEFKVEVKAAADEKGKAVKLVQPQATHQQDGYPIGNAVDNNLATGWAISPQFGKDQSAVFQFDKPLNVKAGATLTFTFDQRFGTGHTVGKFRFSLTADKQPKLASPVPADVVAILDTPPEKRSQAQKDKIRGMYIAQDGEYQRLQREIPIAPPADPRAVGAQDLAWALMNTPAFLFNR